MSKRSINLYIQDIIDSIEKIEKYSKGLDFESFAKDSKTVDAVLRNFSIIGEATRSIPENLRLRYPSVPWNEILGMRNKVVHEYFGVDHEILWKTVQEDLVGFKKEILQVKE